MDGWVAVKPSMTSAMREMSANGTVWTLQALRTFSLFLLLALWGNKNWPPSMKVKNLKKIEKFPKQKWV